MSALASHVYIKICAQHILFDRYFFCPYFFPLKSLNDLRMRNTHNAPGTAHEQFVDYMFIVINKCNLYIVNEFNVVFFFDGHIQNSKQLYFINCRRVRSAFMRARVLSKLILHLRALVQLIELSRAGSEKHLYMFKMLCPRTRSI